MIPIPLIAQIIGASAGMFGYIAAKQQLPIRPMRTFPVYVDTIVITWTDFAVCRP